jgi:hypothetical protein
MTLVEIERCCGPFLGSDRAVEAAAGPRAAGVDPPPGTRGCLATLAEALSRS